MTTYLFVTTSDFFQPEPDTPPASPDKARSHGATPVPGSKTPLIILTLAGVTASFAAIGSNATVALGLSYTIVTALAFLLIERAHREARSGRQSGRSVIYSANGLLSQPASNSTSNADATTSVIRDVAFASSLAIGIAALSMERIYFGGMEYWPMAAKIMGDEWLIMHGGWRMAYSALMVGPHAVMVSTLLIMVSKSADIGIPLRSRAPRGHTRTPETRAYAGRNRLTKTSCLTDLQSYASAYLVCSSCCCHPIAALHQLLLCPTLVRSIMRWSDLRLLHR